MVHALRGVRLKTVRILRDWDYPQLARQTPAGRGIWGDILFTDDPISCPDYAVCFGFPKNSCRLTIDPHRVWSVIAEPPTGWFSDWTEAAQKFSHRVFTIDDAASGDVVERCQPALPWHVDMTYDSLVDLSPELKSKPLSWVTSSQTELPGHRTRMAFLEQLRGRGLVDLYGRGIKPIANKWDGLAPYSYSLAVENYRSATYWSEKLTDCFLAWTVPIYYGCTRLRDYFPEKAFIEIDIEHPDALKQLRHIIENDDYTTRIEALREARDLVLNRYQFFPFIASQITAWEAMHGVRGGVPVEVGINRRPLMPSEIPPPTRRRLLKEWVLRTLSGPLRCEH